MIQMPANRHESLLETLPYETTEAVPVDFNLGDAHISDKVVLVAGLVKSLDADNAESIKSALKFCSYFDSGKCGFSVMGSEVEQTHLREILDIDSSFDFVRDPGDVPHEGPRPYMLAGFRNALLDHVLEKQWDYLVVADLDNTVKWDDQTFGVVLNALDKEDQWDAVAFSSTNYYDWWAARCDSRSKNCLSHKVCLDRREFPCIMETLQDSDTSHFRQVRSAFNGLAVYKRDAIGDCKYDAKNRDTTAPGHKDCEHVGFHDCMTANGARFMLNSGRLHGWWSNLGDEPEEEEQESKDEGQSEEAES